MRVSIGLILLMSLASLGSASALPGPILYTNGSACKANKCAWTIGPGCCITVTDSFVLSSTSTLGSADFAAWNLGCDKDTSIFWEISKKSCGGCKVSCGTSSITSTFLFKNTGSGENINVNCNAFNFSGPITLCSGTYFLTLTDAVTCDCDPVYWDQNNGSSTAFLDGSGSIGSEAFTIFGPAPEVDTDTGVLPVATVAAGLLLVGAQARRRWARKPSTKHPKA